MTSWKTRSIRRRSQIEIYRDREARERRERQERARREAELDAERERTKPPDEPRDMTLDELLTDMRRRGLA